MNLEHIFYSRSSSAINCIDSLILSGATESNILFDSANNSIIYAPIVHYFGSGNIFFSQDNCFFYDLSTSYHYTLEDLFDRFETSFNILLDKLVDGQLICITSSLFFVFDSITSQYIFFSSATSSATFYYLITSSSFQVSSHSSFLFFNTPISLNSSGVAEIVRYGANYTNTTLIDNLFKLPFASYFCVGESYTSPVNFYKNVLKYKNPFSFDEALNIVSSAISCLKPNLLFSGGVDSSVLARCVSNYSFVNCHHLHLNDAHVPSPYWFKSYFSNADIFDYDYIIPSFDDFCSIVSQYSLPCLDFSIFPTHFIHHKASNYCNQFSSVTIDGTGGDAIFGFSSLSNYKIWSVLSALPVSNSLFSSLLKYSAIFPSIHKLFSTLSRTSSHGSPALSHITANPYSLWQLSPDCNSSLHEEDLLDLSSFIGCDFDYSSKEFYQFTDAFLIAISQFAFKSSSPFDSSLNTICFPFYHPLLVSLGLYSSTSLSPDKFLGYKSTLKDYLLRNHFDHEFVTRSKKGFQPPLLDIVKHKDNILLFEDLIHTRHYLDDCFSPSFLHFIRSNRLSDFRANSIHEVYMLWAYLCLKIWLLKLS